MAYAWWAQHSAEERRNNKKHNGVCSGTSADAAGTATPTQTFSALTGAAAQP